MAITFEREKLKLEDNLTGDFVEITPSDSANTTVKGHYPRAFYVGTGGNISFVNTNLTAVLWRNVPAGTMIKGVCYVAVRSTDTTAQNIIAIG